MSAKTEAFEDAVLRRALGLAGYSNEVLTEIAKLLAESDVDLKRQIASILDDTTYSAIRLRKLREVIRETLDATHAAMSETFVKRMQELAEDEADFMAEVARSVDLDFLSPAPNVLRAIVTASPLQGRTMKAWADKWAADDLQRVMGGLRVGINLGESIPNLVKRAIGDGGVGYVGSARRMSRVELTSVVRTAVNHISNEARAEVIAANDDLPGLRYRFVATLDGRTTEICLSLDGKTWKHEKDAKRPPLHFNCRSILVPDFEDVPLEGDRPSVRDTRTPKEREKDFRRDAKERLGDDWATLDEKQRRAEIRLEREKWKAENVKTVPAATKAEAWMRRQSQAFQKDYFGDKRFKLVDQGGLTAKDLWNVAEQRRYTLTELRRKFRDQWDRAGL